MTDTALSLDTLRAQKSRLERRLEDGYHRINEAAAAGKDVTAWEEFWLSLLAEYEQVCDRLMDAVP